MYIKEDYKKDLISALNNEFYYSRIRLSTETYWYDHLVPLKVFLPESKVYYCLVHIIIRIDCPFLTKLIFFVFLPRS